MDKKITGAAWLALHSALDLCMEISTTTKAHCFFDYSPHVNTYSVYIHRNGWVEGASPRWLAMSLHINEENLLRTIRELKQILTELSKEEENV